MDRSQAGKAGAVVFYRMSRPPMIKNGEMLTMKGNKTIHGYGMKSIERMVDKYGGVMSVETETDMFKINIAFFKTEI